MELADESHSPAISHRRYRFPRLVACKAVSHKKLSSSPSCNVTKKLGLEECWQNNICTIYPDLHKVSRALYVLPLVLMRKRIYLKTPLSRSCSSLPESQIKFSPTFLLLFSFPFLRLCIFLSRSRRSSSLSWFSFISTFPTFPFVSFTDCYWVSLLNSCGTVWN